MKYQVLISVLVRPFFFCMNLDINTSSTFKANDDNMKYKGDRKKGKHIH